MMSLGVSTAEHNGSLWIRLAIKSKPIEFMRVMSVLLLPKPSISDLFAIVPRVSAQSLERDELETR